MTDMSPQRPRLGRRIGDAERQNCADRLADEFMAGRLTREEFESRLDQSLLAVTDVDLALLTSDLDPASANVDLQVQPDNVLLAVTPVGVAKAIGLEVVLAVVAFMAAITYGTANWPLIAIFLWAFGSAAAAAGAALGRARTPKSPAD